MVEALGGAPPVMLGIAVMLLALARCIKTSGPELRKWVELFRTSTPK